MENENYSKQKSPNILFAVQLNANRLLAYIPGNTENKFEHVRGPLWRGPGLNGGSPYSKGTVIIKAGCSSILVPSITLT